jgi:hypothetical protein
VATVTALNNLARFSVVGEGCWAWAGTHYPNGYGRCHTGGPGNARGAHRVAYEAHRGPIPTGLVINHLCENKGCVRPDHLETATPRRNVMYSDTPARRNVSKTHCPRGHSYAEYAFCSPPGDSRRRCRACHNSQRKRAAERARIRRSS